MLFGAFGNFSWSSIRLKEEVCLCITNQNYGSVVQETNRAFALDFGFLPCFIYMALQQHCWTKETHSPSTRDQEHIGINYILPLSVKFMRAVGNIKSLSTPPLLMLMVSFCAKWLMYILSVFKNRFLRHLQTRPKAALATPQVGWEKRLVCNSAMFVLDWEKSNLWATSRPQCLEFQTLDRWNNQSHEVPGLYF